MDREQRERLVEGVLARALGPKSVEPRDGFEGRLLATLAAQPERRSWWRWWWVPALAAAAVLAIVIGIRTTRRPAPVIETHRTTAPPEQPVVVAKVPVAPSTVVRHRVVRRVHPHVQLAHATTNLPKQDVFPTPVPATEQEALLLALVQRRPRQVQLIALEQEAQRVRTQKFFDSGDGPEEPATAQQMR